VFDGCDHGALRKDWFFNEIAAGTWVAQCRPRDRRRAPARAALPGAAPIKPSVLLVSALLIAAAAVSRLAMAGDITLLNVSYDPTRELWKDINSHFIPAYEKETGNKLTINQSHGGSSSQA